MRLAWTLLQLQLLLVVTCLSVLGQNVSLIATPVVKYDLVSPGWNLNLNYDANLTFDFLVKTNYPNHTIIVSIVGCEIEHDKNGQCLYDMIYFYDGSDNNSAEIGPEFCCATNSGSWVSTGSSMYLRFTSDSTNEYRGFQLSYVSTGPSTTSPESTTITTTRHLTNFTATPEGSISCFSCTNVTNIPECSTVSSCPSDSICSSEFTTSQQGLRLYTLGCKPISSCTARTTANAGGFAALVGRSTTENRMCSGCCNTSYCNRQMCQSADSTCSDNTDLNCEAITAAGFNLCHDETYAKQNCKRYCGFCNTVDGGWSTWTTWSFCDVTCANGTRTRSRACNNPAPAYGGSDCVGDAITHGMCTEPMCPVNGGWSQWSNWGSCTVSCVIGLQRRDRTCSNPYPARNGDHCYGDSHDYRICAPGPCADGQWSMWSAWGSCDKTCDCGVRTRTRTCDNPVPSLTGKHCSGETTEAESCNSRPCQGPVVFRAKDLNATNPEGNGTLRFIHVTTNIGNGYCSSTGIFTAPAAGNYTFSAQFCSHTHLNVSTAFVVNDVIYLHLNSLPFEKFITCISQEIDHVLNLGDQVKIQYNAEYFGAEYLIDTNLLDYFSGTLMGL